MTPDELRRVGHRAVELAAAHLEELAAGPVWRPVPPEVRSALRDRPLPDGGVDVDALLDQVARWVLPHPFGNGHPRFLGWGNPPPDPVGAVADLLAAAMNPSCAGGDHAAIHLEHGVVRWLAELVGHPGHGVLVGGGATGALTALAAARHQALGRLGRDDNVEGVTGGAGPHLRLYTSEEAHSCHRKALRLLGLGDRSLHPVATDRAGRLRPDDQARAVDADRRGGLVPWAVVASAGTVGTGAVDPLAELARLCRREDLWLHVDGSLGGFGVLDRRRRNLFEGLDLADSLVLDPHKWLSVPIDSAVVLVRDLDLLRSTFSLVPSYLRTEEEPWFSEFVIDQTRPFRALRTWLVVAAAGRRGLSERIERDCDHAARLALAVDGHAGLELLAPVELQVVAFRPVGMSDDEVRALPRLVQEEGEVFVTGVVVDGREAVRVCCMNQLTTTDDIDRVIPAVLRARERLRAADRLPADGGEPGAGRPRP